MTDRGGLRILHSIDCHTLRKLDLSNNNLGEQSIEKIADHFKQKNCAIKYLNLENTNISSTSLESLCESMH